MPVQRPHWFDAWLNSDRPTAPRRGSVRVLEAEIIYRVTAGAPNSDTTVVFVHGGQANSRWWDATLAGLGTQAPRAVALDLSGHGESSWRPHYSAEVWVAEITAVIEKEAPGGCVLVGHSLGGGLALRLAVTGHPLVSAVVSVDAAPGGPLSQPTGRKASATTFPSYPDAVHAFIERKRAWPPWLASYVAAESVRSDGRGWRWKHDGSVRGVDPSHKAPTGNWQCPVTVVRGETSAMTPKTDECMWWSQWSSGGRFKCIEQPGVGHDIMMENPLGFAKTLERICPIDVYGDAG